MKTRYAFRHWDGSDHLARIVDGDDEWDEPIQGWSEVHDLIRGKMTYRHKDGREYPSQPSIHSTMAAFAKAAAYRIKEEGYK